MFNFKKLKFSILLILGLASLSLFILPPILGINAALFASTLENYGIPELIYIAWMVLATATTLPISVAIFAGVAYFSFTKAILLTCAGILMGAIGTFYFSKWLGEGFVKADYGISSKTKLHIFNELLHKGSTAYVILLSFVYAFPSNLAFMIAGVTGMSFFRLLPIVFFGNLGTAFAVGGIILGLLRGNVAYILGGAAVLLVINVLPIVLYSREMKKLVLLVFSRKAYERFVRLEKFEKRVEEDVVKAEKAIIRTEKKIERRIKGIKRLKS